MRDDFDARDKELLAKRVGYRCSNPYCGQQTSGPQADPDGAINVGVAAHITAASPGGKRYDATLTPEQRSDPANGIWLCQKCAKLIDDDPIRYPEDVLRAWKRAAEHRARLEVEGAPGWQRSDSQDRTAMFAKLERYMPKLLDEMRNDLRDGPPAREFVLLKKGWAYNSAGYTLCYYYDDHPNLDSQVQMLENYGLVRDVTHGRNSKHFRISEMLADYLTQ